MAKKSESESKHESKQTSSSEVSKDEQIGFHKGALSTLAKEREELLKMVNIVEQLMQMHVKALQQLGVDLTKSAGQKTEEPKKDSKPKKPIEDLLR